MGSTIVYRGCDQSLEGVDPSRNHGMGSTLVYNLRVLIPQGFTAWGLHWSPSER